MRSAAASSSWSVARRRWRAARSWSVCSLGRAGGTCWAQSSSLAWAKVILADGGNEKGRGLKHSVRKMERCHSYGRYGRLDREQTIVTFPFGSGGAVEEGRDHGVNVGAWSGVSRAARFSPRGGFAGVDVRFAGFDHWLGGLLGG